MPKKLLVHFPVECDTIQILTESVSNVTNGNTSMVVQDLHVKVIIQNVISKLIKEKKLAGF